MRRFWPGLMVLLWTSAAAWGSPPHDFHVSITRIDYRPYAGVLEVTVKVFTDDLERSMERLGAPRLQIGSAMEHAHTDSLIANYLANRLQFWTDGQMQGHRFLGKEVELDATWCYLEVPLPANSASMQVHNRILVELFEDQANLVHFHGAKGLKSYLMDSRTSVASVEF